MRRPAAARRPEAADRAAHHVGGDQPGQGKKVMPGETLSGMVAVEAEEEGPDRLHVEAGELCKGLCELRVGFLAEQHGAVMIGTAAQIGAERLGTGVFDPAGAGMGLEGRVFLALLRNLSGPQREKVADEHVEEFLPVALEAAFDGPQVVGVEPFLRSRSSGIRMKLAIMSAQVRSRPQVFMVSKILAGCLRPP